VTKENNPPDPATLLEIYRRATLIKQNDDRFRSVIQSGRLVMPYYSPRGQEIIPSATSVHLRDSDSICTIYRGIHDMLAKGVQPRDLWAELAGKATGSCKGKGGPMHITDPARGVMVTTGIVGSTMPIANGLALAAQLRGSDGVTVAYFGDGASNIGAFHEALNLASVWRLPVVFICQNNGYAEHTRYELGTAVARIADRASAYTMPGERVNGNDAVEMWNAAGRAIARARGGGGPTLLEAMTFRFHGHIFGDDDGYMMAGEKDAAVARDPVLGLRRQLVESGVATAAELTQMEAAIEHEIDEALRFALESPYPDVDELRRDVYATEIPA
jgi:TPP-dependent pyruvate/acetoin dehydrogenase alpha subunit